VPPRLIARRCAQFAETMRLTTILLLTIINISASGQRLTGKYNDYFGHTLELKEDSTFRLEWKFDLVKTWAIGQWTYSNDIVYLKFNDIYDTLTRTGKPDSLVLSNDENPNRINKEEFAIYQISSGGQKHVGITDRLTLKRKRLYLTDKNGRPFREKQPGIWTTKKRPTYYIKTE